ncbi:MAG: hypothetical protein LBT04_01270 [Prevotellaceae bacterium]|jgi:hypothetical protein|nr:hypothetical protein [Prevotellaceae bacterium]
MNKIKSLEEISLNIWKSKYSGKNGEYEIQIFMDDNYGKSSCNCCSYFYPCRHIGIVRRAIERRQRKEKWFWFAKKIRKIVFINKNH